MISWSNTTLERILQFSSVTKLSEPSLAAAVALTKLENCPCSSKSKLKTAANTMSSQRSTESRYWLSPHPVSILSCECQVASSDRLILMGMQNSARRQQSPEGKRNSREPGASTKGKEVQRDCRVHSSIRTGPDYQVFSHGLSNSRAIPQPGSTDVKEEARITIYQRTNKETALGVQPSCSRGIAFLTRASKHWQSLTCIKSFRQSCF